MPFKPFVAPDDFSSSVPSTPLLRPALSLSETLSVFAVEDVSPSEREMLSLIPLPLVRLSVAFVKACTCPASV